MTGLISALQARPELAWFATALAVLAAAPCAYLLGLALAALTTLRRKGAPETPGPSGLGHLVFVVPAHNEEADIEATLHALCAQCDGDSSVHVIADNCSDRT